MYLNDTFYTVASGTQYASFGPLDDIIFGCVHAWLLATGAMARSFYSFHLADCFNKSRNVIVFSRPGLAKASIANISIAG